MSTGYSIIVGTVGSGLFRSADSGGSFKQIRFEIPFGPWSAWVEIRCVTVSPLDPNLVWAGSNIGLHKSIDGGETFEFVSTPFDKYQIWAIAVDPRDSDRIFVGIAPFDSTTFDAELPLWQSTDGGASWVQVGLRTSPKREIIGATHVTAIAFTPQEPDTMFATVEIGGLFKSTDAGTTWTKLGPLGDSILDEDNHFVTVTPNGTILVTSPMGLYRSTNGGGTFTTTKFGGFPVTDPLVVQFGVTGYSRGIAFNRAEPETFYVGIGDSTPGMHGAIMVSHDNGESWGRAKLPVEPNSHIYHVITHPADPDRIVAASMNGYLYTSGDAGRTWEKNNREFGEIRGLAWLPT